LFTWLPATTVPDSALIVFATDDDYLFGVLHSKVHELWARGTGTQLREVESGFRYTPTTTFDTFPFPRPVEEQRNKIAALARRLDDLRRGWLNPSGLSDDVLETRTLTELYNQRPPWLADVHGDLDRAVLDAYGWPSDLDDDAILGRLLHLNLEGSSADLS
jgi:type II restriction/modification system DNA methylase subunit YeeA